MTTIEQVNKAWDELSYGAREVIVKKGHDYNREQQEEGDTLFNMTVCRLLGVTDTVTAGILVRLCDKFMRLISLTKDPNVKAEVDDERVKDTIQDAMNYMVYLYCKYQEEMKEGSK